MSSDLASRLAREAVERFARPVQVAIAPGRVNLIGGHTDYNDGSALPMAIDRYVGVAVAARGDDRLQVCATDYGDATQSFSVQALTDGAPHEGWAGYVAGVAWALQEHSVRISGADLLIGGTVPIGAGLSSSAALEMAVARALCAISDTPWAPAEMARIGRRAENDYVGVACGIMDQFASAACEAGSALLLDCRSLKADRVPIPKGAQVVIMDTGVRRSLSDSAYNERRRQCQTVVSALRRHDGSVRALRDVTSEMLEDHRHTLPPLAYRRARHVVAETNRPPRMAAALRTGFPKYAGTLMNDSHESLRDLYEVSSKELDALVEAAQQHPACYGARLTGAGMGGCAVALVEREASDGFIETVRAAYSTRFDHPCAFYACEPASGASLASSDHSA